MGAPQWDFGNAPLVEKLSEEITKHLGNQSDSEHRHEGVDCPSRHLAAFSDDEEAHDKAPVRSTITKYSGAEDYARWCFNKIFNTNFAMGLWAGPVVSYQFYINRLLRYSSLTY